VATINVFHDCDEMISDSNRNFDILSLNSSKGLTFLGLHIVAMFRNIVGAQSE